MIQYQSGVVLKYHEYTRSNTGPTKTSGIDQTGARWFNKELHTLLDGALTNEVRSRKTRTMRAAVKRRFPVHLISRIQRAATEARTKVSQGLNIKWLAEYCGTSVAMIEKHYGRYITNDSTEQLERLFGAKTEIFTETLREEPMTK